MILGIRIKKAEWIAVISLAVFIMGLTVLPYLYAAAITPSGRVYTGIRLNNAPDTFSYMAWIEQARQGKVLLTELYTSEPQTGALFQPVFLILGALGRISHFSNILLYHIFRVIGGLIFFLLGYILLSLYFEPPSDRLMAFGIFATASGLGWLVRYPSIDIVKMEANNFFTVYESLLDPIALSLMLGIFLIFLRENKKLFWYFVVPAILTNSLILIHPYDFVSVALVCFGYAVYRYFVDKDRWSLRQFLYLILGSFPAILIQAWTLYHNQPLAIWGFLQTSAPALAPQYYLCGYGLVGLLAIVGLFLRWHEKKPLAFLCIWISLSVILLFAPFLKGFQQRLSLGLFIPLSILCAATVVWWVKEIQAQFKVSRVLSYSIILTTLVLTNIYIIARIDLPYSRTGQFPIYLKQPQADALSWIRNSVPDGSVILAGSQLSLAIPAYSGRAVFFGHYDQTTDFDLKYEIAKKMFSSPATTPNFMPDFLLNNGINYLVIDSEVREWVQGQFLPAPYLAEQYDNGEVQVYKVNLYTQ